MYPNFVSMSELALTYSTCDAPGGSDNALGLNFLTSTVDAGGNVSASPTTIRTLLQTIGFSTTSPGESPGQPKSSQAQTSNVLAASDLPSSSSSATQENTNPRQKRKREANEDLGGATPLQPTRVDLYLASLSVSGVEPTLSDLERCRPSRHPDTLTPEYTKAYNAVLDTLCRSFSKAQLRHFIKLYHLPPALSKKSRTKTEYAETIIEEKWGWPSLEAVERAKRDRTEVAVRSFSVTPSQLFLILGRDGRDLLQLVMKYNVHISLTGAPLALRAEGLRGDIKALEERIRDIKKGVVEETFQLPTHTPIEPALIQRVSRLAGAFIENVGSKGLIRLSARNSDTLNSAKRLATRALTELHLAKTIPLLSYLPMGVPSLSEVPSVLFPHTYSLYPFLSPQSLPWYITQTSAFRVRRVGEWLNHSTTENIEQTGGLAGNKGRILTVSHEAVDLRDVLLGGSTVDSIQDANTQRIVKASLGHMLFTSGKPDTRSILRPPLTGTYQFAKVLDWIQNHDVHATFVANLPAALVHTPPSQQRLVHRLVYKALPPSASTYPSGSPSTNNGSTMPATHTINLEIVLARPKQDDTPKPEGFALSFTPRCWMGTEAKLDLLLPDRSIDARLTVLDTIDISQQMPAEIQNYISELRTFMTSTDKNHKHPDAPLVILRDGSTYVLHSSANVRQNVEQLHDVQSDTPAASAVEVLSESVLDLESKQRATRCEIACNSPDSEEAWTEFLKQCDFLSGVNYRPAGALPLSDADTEPATL
ncbi:hypothetical protein NM688_g3008 [Phlebia brevispora]|uniref:Uncharacterized protein n=1 Tax=Phlebia brevispora TaxID=194682 RepID=A0ACC1T719_9APHY|nr:hypothetical protein NM688_g3008 [Phlebia brevispora]